ncbi:hypothetical protein GQX74_001840 [Glossina fuscipes]|nr:hypothetical protein GQX74_001840 [Glossina fuscipes]
MNKVGKENTDWEGVCEQTLSAVQSNLVTLKSPIKSVYKRVIAIKGSRKLVIFTFAFIYGTKDRLILILLFALLLYPKTTWITTIIDKRDIWTEGPIGASIVAISPRTVLDMNPALAMSKPLFESRGPPITSKNFKDTEHNATETSKQNFL